MIDRSSLPPRVLVAPDKLRGTATAQQAAAAISAGVRGSRRRVSTVARCLMAAKAFWTRSAAATGSPRSATRSAGRSRCHGDSTVPRR